MVHLFCLSSLWVAQLSEEFEQRFRMMETSLKLNDQKANIEPGESEADDEDKSDS